MNGLEVKMQDRSEPEGGANPVHLSVLPAEVLEYGVSPEAAESGGWFLDGTLGAAGHSSLLLGSYPRLRILGIDQDPDVAKLLGVSDKHSITKLCRTRALPRTKVRGTSRFKIDEVLAWAKLHGRKVNRAALRAASKT